MDKCLPIAILVIFVLGLGGRRIVQIPNVDSSCFTFCQVPARLCLPGARVPTPDKGKRRPATVWNQPRFVTSAHCKEINCVLRLRLVFLVAARKRHDVKPARGSRQRPFDSALPFRPSPAASSPNMESPRGRVEGAASYQRKKLLNLVPKQPRGLIARMTIPVDIDYDRDCWKYVVLGLDPKFKFMPSINILGGWTYVTVSHDALVRMYSRMENLPYEALVSERNEACETIMGERTEIVVRSRKLPNSTVKTFITIQSMIEKTCESRITLCNDDVEELKRLKGYIFFCLKTLKNYCRPLVADQMTELVYYLDVQLTRRGASRKPLTKKKMISFIKKVKFDTNILIPKHEANYVPELLKYAIKCLAKRLLIISSWSHQVKVINLILVLKT